MTRILPSAPQLFALIALVAVGGCHSAASWPVLTAQAERAYRNQNPKAAADFATEARQAVERERPQDVVAVAGARNLEGNLLVEAGHTNAALATLREALILTDEQAVPATVSATSLNNLGKALLEANHESEAKEAFEGALEIWALTLGPDHPWTAIAATNLVAAETRLGERGDGPELQGSATGVSAALARCYATAALTSSGAPPRRCATR